MTHPRTIVVIDDELAIRRLLRTALESPECRVHEAETGQLGLMAVAQHRPEVVLLDLGLPDLDGLEVLDRLREWSDVPVIVLTVRDDPAGKIAALDSGADDYVTKPFHTGELLARVRAVAKRRTGGSEPPEYAQGPLRVDFPARRVMVEGVEVHLTATEYALLREFLRYRGRILTHHLLLRAVWGDAPGADPQYLRVYVAHLRRKLGCTAGGYLVTEVGVGYRWQD